MAEITATPAEEPQLVAVRYEPGWIHRFVYRIDQLPIPYWVFYAGVTALLIGVVIALQWLGGVPPAFHPIYFMMGSAAPYVFLSIHYLNHLASDMLSKSRPTLRVTQAEYDALLYRITTSPAREVWGATAMGIFVGIFLFLTVPFSLQQQIFQMVDTPLSLFTVRAFTIVNFMLVTIGWYHTQHQLRVVRTIYERYTEVNLFNLKPLYAFSVFSARTALFYALYPYALLASVPLLLELDFTRAVLLVVVFMVITVFLWPLLGVHQRLEAEKDRQVLENSQRLQRSVKEMNEHIDTNQYGRISELKDVVASIELEQARINRISTWPWQPGTLRGLVASVFLPLVLWGLQWAVERLIQPPTP